MIRRYPYPDIEDHLTQLLAQGMKDREAVYLMHKGFTAVEPKRFNEHVQVIETLAIWDCLLGYAVPQLPNLHAGNIYSARRQQEATDFAEVVRAMTGVKK
jgi:hypothetical protein